MKLHYRQFQTLMPLRKRMSLQDKVSKFGNYQILLPDLTANHILNIVPSHIQKPDYSNVKAVHGSIPIHSKGEIQGIRNACQIAKQVLDIGCKAAQVGMTTLEIDEIIHKEIIKRNAYPSPLNYMSFPKSICTSINNVLCHGIPDKRKLVDGDILNIDVTVFYQGFHGDTSRTIPIGNVDGQGLALIQRNKLALEKAIEIVKPGTYFSEIGRVIQEVADKYQYTIDQNFCGHGIGTLFHQPPLILHYRNSEIEKMAAGMVFTIEPIFCQGSTMGYNKWPDQWTVVSKDGSRSAQHEHTILVTESGSEILTL